MPIEDILGFMCSKLSTIFLSGLNPTLNFQIQDISNLPYAPVQHEKNTISDLISLSKNDWDSHETSWDFKELPLLKSNHQQFKLKNSYSQLFSNWTEIVKEMQNLEQKNNSIFIEAYGLEDELTPVVPLSEITLTFNPHYRYPDNSRKIYTDQERDAMLLADTIKEFISYSAGCMFGRYSLDKPGLILANQEETLEDYLAKIPEPSFEPDDDNVIPITDVDWFEDDIVERFKHFLKVTFGQENYAENLTFTNKAGEEMKERLGNLKEDQNRLFIGTFHGFCQYVLENHGKAIGFEKIPHIFNDESDRLKLIEQAIEKTPSYYSNYERYDESKKRKFCYDVLNFISKVKRRLLSEEELAREGDDIVLLYTTYNDILNSQNAIDFDDLILLTYNLFINNPKIAALYRRTYEYICIDEAQDLNYAQYQLLRALTNGEHINIMMVGDPNQSIFAFNDSSADYMSKMFVEDFIPEIIELNENYRSSQSVIKAAEQIIKVSSDIANMVIPGLFEIYKAEDEKEETEWIIDKISELINLKRHDDIEGEISYEKIAVLARNKYIFQNLTEVFDNNRIPYYFKITPGAVKFESKLMKNFDMAFRVKINPEDTLHLHKILDLFQASKAKNIRELENLTDDKIDKAMFNTVNNINDNGDNLKISLNNFKKFIEKNNTLDDDEKKMILSDIQELLQHWFKYAKTTDKKSLLHFKNSMALGKTHPLTEKNGVTLSTVHTMKGQEYDIVFLMGMDDGTFPDYRAVRAGGKDLIQEKNNTYVAFTRAKRFLYVSWPSRRLMPWGDVKIRRASRFLDKFEI